MNSLQIVSSKKDFFLIIIFLLFVFLLNIIYEYMKYKDFTSQEVYYSNFKIENIYDKEDFYVLKLQENNLVLYTSIEKNNSIKKLRNINIAILTTNLSFYEFLKGFYTKSIYYDEISTKNTIKEKLFLKINKQHKNEKLQELFSALFLAIPVSKVNRKIYTNLSISHLIAISGFHLAILSFIIYWLIYFPYSYLHKRYFIFRNKSVDVMAFTILILFLYLLLTNMVPSLLRSFVMFFLAFLFLRSNLKILSFQTLALTFLIIISLFPQFLFSISFWFSIIGVFYIFLYLEYFKNLPKLFSILFFNIWIFFVFNPIVHFFFFDTTIEQLLSPLLTLGFSIFYPIELMFHIFSYGDFLDSFILDFLEYKFTVFDVITPLWFFLFYIVLSIGSVFYNKAFIVLNILMVLFNCHLYL